MTRPQPQLISVKLEQLHPTQLTVGMEEVVQKRKEWSKLGKKARATALDRHWFPSITGPDGRHYIVDHHHFGLALLQEEVKTVWALPLKDLSILKPPHFWNVMDHHQWVHPYDDQGVRRDFSAVPPQLELLRDDPYRSLAGELRRAGGFAKDVTPFSEFLWADFFRPRIKRSSLQKDLAKALLKAMQLAHSQEAHYLPGWSGPIAAK
ncbi:ParB-like protein [Paraherbaspirillum soli]|uniref:ParB-like protein n=1 Tax=Paraherbaspirillum soli TaxID=631222 RepID=A0ABW0M3D6_9BURK